MLKGIARQEEIVTVPTVDEMAEIFAAAVDEEQAAIITGIAIRMAQWKPHEQVLQVWVMAGYLAKPENAAGAEWLRELVEAIDERKATTSEPADEKTDAAKAEG